MYDGSLTRLAFDAINQDYQLECLHIGSPCGLGFSQHGSWVPSGAIPSISVEETRASCHFSEHDFFWSSKKQKLKVRSVRLLSKYEGKYFPTKRRERDGGYLRRLSTTFSPLFTTPLKLLLS